MHRRIGRFDRSAVKTERRGPKLPVSFESRRARFVVSAGPQRRGEQWESRPAESTTDPIESNVSPLGSGTPNLGSPFDILRLQGREKPGTVHCTRAASSRIIQQRGRGQVRAGHNSGACISIVVDYNLFITKRL